MKNFKDKVVVVTGAGSGIGQATAIEFARLGAKLALNDYAAENLSSTIAELKKLGTVYYAEGFDVSDRVAFKKFAENVKSNLGAADVVMNNAGIATESGNYLKIGIEGFEKLMNINYWSVVYGTIFFTSQLLENNKEAAIINVSSLDGLAGFPGKADYCSAKAAVRGFNESIAYDLIKSNVQVHSVHPGGIATNIAKKDYKGNTVDLKEHAIYDKAYLKTSPKVMALAIIDGVKKKRFRILAGEKILWAYFGILALPFQMLQKFVLKDYKNNGLGESLEEMYLR